MTEMVYIQKLSKVVNVVPVLVQKEGYLTDSQQVKIESQRLLLENDIEWFDMQEDDLTFKQFQNELIARTTPFLLRIQKQNLLTEQSDLKVLVKMITTPYINTYYYKTELKHNSFVQDKRVNDGKDMFKKKQDDEENLTYGKFGLAVGIGLIGAFCAFKKNIFN